MNKKKIIIIASVVVLIIGIFIVMKLNSPKVISKDLAKIPSTFVARVVYSQTSGPDASAAKNYYICKEGDIYNYTCFTYYVTIKGESEEVEIEEGKLKNKKSLNKIFKEIEKEAEKLQGHSTTIIYLKDGAKLENQEALADFLFK